MRNFRIQIISRISGIVATVFLAIWLYEYSGSIMAVFLLSLGVFAQIIALIRYVDKTNRDLSRFLNSVRYSDFSQSFTGSGRGKSFTELGQSFGQVMDDFRKARGETEEQHRFLQTVVQHVGTGLISFDRKGDVGLINNAAKRLFGVQHLKNVTGLRDYSTDLVNALGKLRAGDRSVIKVVRGDEMQELILSGAEFRVRGEFFTLVAIQDIQSELEEKELQAWLKLTHVLTHEIMNSITPIASLAASAHEILNSNMSESEPADTNSDIVNEDKEWLEDVRDAIQTINRRSQGLLHFVQAYRSMTRIPRPNLKIFPVVRLLDSVHELFRAELETTGIQLNIKITPPELDVTADPELIEQILINLVKNAIQMNEPGKAMTIRLSARIGTQSRPVLSVTDDGPGIEPEALDKIFVPFFTTKKEGSGIGLSLSRQIMRQHGGSMSVFSDPGNETTFSLRF